MQALYVLPMIATFRLRAPQSGHRSSPVSSSVLGSCAQPPRSVRVKRRAALFLAFAILAACAGPERATPRTVLPSARVEPAGGPPSLVQAESDTAPASTAPCADPAGCALPPTPVAPPYEDERAGATNLDGEALAVCSRTPLTGFYRDGRCASGPDDRGVHVVCAQMTRAFLNHSVARGNDLVTPVAGRFPGLRPGDRWCLCALRWEEARRAGVAPPVVHEATERRALDFTSRAALDAHALAAPSR